MTPTVLRVIRHLYVLLISYLIMLITMFLGILCNITGVRAKDPDPLKFDAGIRATTNALLTILIATIVYILIEYAFRTYLKNNKIESVAAQPGKYSGILAYFYLIVYSYMFQMISFSLTSYNFFINFCSAIALNIIFIFIIIRLYISKNRSRKSVIKHWTAMLLLSVFLFFLYSSKPFWSLNKFIMN